VTETRTADSSPTPARLGMPEAAPAESALSRLLRALSVAVGGASAQPAAGDAIDVPAESEPSLLLHALAGDPLHVIVQLLGDANLPCFRLVCRAFRDHSSKPEKMYRRDFLRTRALTVYAWERMPGFILALPRMLILAARRSSMLRLAASVGCVEVLEELVDNRQCELTAGACAAAAGRGHLGALAWLHSRGSPWDFQTCCRAAAGGHLEVLRYAHEHGCPWDISTCYEAAMGGHLEVLRYAHERGCPWDNYICSQAAMGGHLEVLRYAHEHGCPWDISICYDAALGGHLEVLRYAYERGCPWDIYTCSEAAMGGHLEVLQYAHEHGCPWDTSTCYEAAMGGHLEVLRYAHEHGCPWDSATCYCAAEGGHLEVLRYAHEHGCPFDRESCCAAALQYGHAEVSAYLRAAKAAA
jgi:hypothetical protein